MNTYGALQVWKSPKDYTREQRLEAARILATPRISPRGNPLRSAQAQALYEQRARELESF